MRQERLQLGACSARGGVVSMELRSWYSGDDVKVPPSSEDGKSDEADGTPADGGGNVDDDDAADDGSLALRGAPDAGFRTVLGAPLAMAASAA